MLWWIPLPQIQSTRLLPRDVPTPDLWYTTCTISELESWELESRDALCEDAMQRAMRETFVRGAEVLTQSFAVPSQQTISPFMTITFASKEIWERVERCYDVAVEPSVLETDRDLLGCSDLRRHRLNIMRTLSTHMARSLVAFR